MVFGRPLLFFFFKAKMNWTNVYFQGKAFSFDRVLYLHIIHKAEEYFKVNNIYIYILVLKGDESESIEQNKL
jgi:hypothetical protein